MTMPAWSVIQGDARSSLAQLTARSVQCVVTSPPYWGLRDYGTATWEGGDLACGHIEKTIRTRESLAKWSALYAAGGGHAVPDQLQYRATCGMCGARRIDSQIGLEPTPDAYVQSLVEVFQSVWRVLKDDGVCWLNLGDSYANDTKWGGSTSGKHVSALHGGLASGQRLKRATGMKPKDLVGIPWRVAFALQADGWYLRSDIIWAKPNPMPESVTDRPTKAHEYIFLLSKSERYFYDADAITERNSDDMIRRAEKGHTRGANGKLDASRMDAATLRGEHAKALDVSGRNCRSVWSITTQPYPDAHFATFPEAIPERCIKAGTSAMGQCPVCGMAWGRITETEYKVHDNWFGEKQGARHSRGAQGTSYKEPLGTMTTGWQPRCSCKAGEPVPQTVLDPFCGSGTTGQVAIQCGRSFIGIELNPAYAEMARTRIGGAAPLFSEEIELKDTSHPEIPFTEG